MSKTILFSGRFDPVHLSHIRTLQRIAREYDKVIVCVLDYPDRFEPINDTLKVLRDTLGCCFGNYDIMVNTVNLEHTTHEDMETLPAFDVIGTGNQAVFFNMTKLKIPVVAVKRTPEYNGTDIRNWHELCRFVEERKMFK